MPFIESVPTTEYMIAVNLAPSSLSEPKLSPRPIAGARKNLSAMLFVGGTCGLSTKTHSPSRWFTSERSALPSRAAPGRAASSASASANRRGDRLLEIVLRRVERRCLKFETGIVLFQPRLAQPEDLRDPLDPSLAPLGQLHLAGRALDKISPYVTPAE